MKQAISILLLLTMLFPLAACRAEEAVVAVPSDAERIVEVALAAQDHAPEAEEALAPPESGYEEERYTFSATAAEGRLNITADAQVRYPVSLQLPIARVAAVGFTQEQASAYFEYFFAGEQPIVEDGSGANTTKQELRDMIALYESQIADGTIMEQSQFTAEEARAYIKELEARIPNAPETKPPDMISDGAMLPGIVWDNDNPEPSLELNVYTDRAYLHIYTPVNALDHFTGHLFYNRRDRDGFAFPGTERTELAPHTSIAGMTVTWDEAMRVCEDFFAVEGQEDLALGKAYRVEKDGKLGYRFYFVRTVAGVPAAQHFEFTRYKGSNTPWDYENIILTVDDGGLLSAQWGSPTKTTEIVNPAAGAMPFAEAAELFETMAVEIYDTDQTVGPGRNTDLRVNRIELSLLRIRDISTDERVGLYVPAWVFYGERFSNGSPYTNWTPQVVFAINAIDGSVINMELGY